MSAVINRPAIPPELERFVTRPFPYDHAPICAECDGCGLNGDSGEGFWEQTPCDHCNGTGYEPEKEEA